MSAKSKKNSPKPRKTLKHSGKQGSASPTLTSDKSVPKMRKAESTATSKRLADNITHWWKGHEPIISEVLKMILTLILILRRML